MSSATPTDPPPCEERFLRRAIDLAHEGVVSGEGGPFGALVVRDGEILAEGWNRVLTDNDPTAHAEVTALRRACAAVGDFQLPGAVVYSSCEPCPMCLGALYWARPAAVYFAASRHDAAAAAFDDSFIYDELARDSKTRSLPFRQVRMDGSVAPFEEWLAKTDRTAY